MKLNLKIKIGLLILVSTIAMLGPARPAYALFGMGDIVSVNVWDMTKEVLASAGVTMLKSANERYTRQFLSEAMDRYKITDYQRYANDLINDVFVNQQLVKMTRTDAYLMKANIRQLSGQPDVQGLDVVARKQAYDSFNIYDTNRVEAGADFYEFLGQTSNFIDTTPQGRKLAAEARADRLLSEAKAAAAQELSSGNGFKSSYSCTRANLKDSYTDIRNQYDDVSSRTLTDTGALNAGLITLNNCVVQNPASYVTNSINSKIDELYANQVKPSSYYSAFLGQIAGTILSKRLDNAILNKKSRPASQELDFTDDSTNLAPTDRTLYQDIYGDVNN